MRPSVFVRTQYWYAEGVPAASNFHTGLLQTVWKCQTEKQPEAGTGTWPLLSPSLVAPLVKLKRKSSGRPHYLTRPGRLALENSTETILFGRWSVPLRKSFPIKRRQKSNGHVRVAVVQAGLSSTLEYAEEINQLIGRN